MSWVEKFFFGFYLSFTLAFVSIGFVKVSLLFITLLSSLRSRGCVGIPEGSGCASVRDLSPSPFCFLGNYVFIIIYSIM
jgi:hypothetical protein